MLRASGLRTAGRFYAFATPADLVVKLPASRVDELINSGRGLTCSPRPGRPMKEWVRIPGGLATAAPSWASRVWEIGSATAPDSAAPRSGMASSKPSAA